MTYPPRTSTQKLAGLQLPTGTWSIEPGHAVVTFVARSFGLSKVRGRFTGVVGTVEVAPDPSASSVDVTIDMDSVDSGSGRRDHHLRSADFFDVDNHPTARFTSRVVAVEGTRAKVTGDLTIKGITRQIVLDVEYVDSVHAAFRGAVTVDRDDWHVRNMALDRGSWLASKHIKLEADVTLGHRCPSSSF